MAGERYPISGKTFPSLRPWAEKVLGFDSSMPSPSPQDIRRIEEAVPKSRIPEAFFEELRSLDPDSNIQISESAADRVDHAHGQTLGELYAIRYGSIEKFPDLVVWPRSHEQTELVVRLAQKHNVGLIPFGGGTSVSLAVQVPKEEVRPVISLDTKLMNKILEINPHNMTVLAEAGCVGQSLERELRQEGFTTGHEPDSLEFSTLGGWVATRASGMKKNTYGNIEDLLVAVRLVSPEGSLARECEGPRVSTGPDLNHLVLGSEGIFGVITQVRLKIRPVPKHKLYGSLLLPNFQAGFNVMREVAFHRIQPASIRLMDSMQFQLGHCLKPKDTSLFGWIFSWLQKFYVTQILGFKQDEMVAITLLFEGDDLQEIKKNMRTIQAINRKHGGINAGSSNGERGYQMTFAIGYLREFAMDYQFVTESFETAVPWDKALHLCSSVKNRIAESCKQKGISKPPFVSCRVTQTYDVGCCIYFYFGFLHFGMKENPGEVYHELESAARDEIEACGGSLSHHHGVGKLRRPWYERAVSSEGLRVMKGLKKTLDPLNIFCSQNLFVMEFNQ